MHLINTDGMSIIGPGSEWLWTAISGIVLAGTALAIYGQLRDAQGAALIARLELLTNKWQSPILVYGRLRTLVILRDGRNLENGDQAAADVFDFMESLAILLHEGVFSEEELWVNWSWAIRPWWRILGPVALAARADAGVPDTYTGFEDLEAVCAEIDTKKGIVRPALALAIDYDGLIDRHRDRLRIAYDVEARLIPKG